MSKITLTINDKQVVGEEGDTVLDVCKKNGIDVPTLCHFKGLTDVGACRLCIVEIEKERRPVPSCTYPARDGLVVRTHTEKLERDRRQILELMFAERNHLCPYCVASGDCELQNLAYKYQMDNIRYELPWPQLAVDSLHQHLVIDHNRCILCGRCIRACDEIACVHTLDFGNRGWKDMVCADLNQSLGQSSCISCGACFQVCPTGAISAKSGTYRGRPEEFSTVESVCTLCGIGCSIKALVKDNKVVRIDSPDLFASRGLLCYKGRFEQIYDKKNRITKPLMKKNGKFEVCTLDQALDAIAVKFAEVKSKHGSDSLAGLASSRISNEALKAFKELMTGKAGTKLVDTLDGASFRVISEGIAKYKNGGKLDIEASLEDIFKADCIVIAGADPLTTHPVIGAAVLNANKKNKAKIIVIDANENPFNSRTAVWLKPKQGKEEAAVKALTDMLKKADAGKASKESGIDAELLTDAAKTIGDAKSCFIIYGEGILTLQNPDVIAALLNLASVAGKSDKGTLKILSLKPQGNSRGAWEKIGLCSPQRIDMSKVKAAYIVLADDSIDPKLLDSLKKMEFLAIQASYLSPVVEKADVILPSPIAVERNGTYTTLDGKAITVACLVASPEGVKQDHDTIKGISQHFSAR